MPANWAIFFYKSRSILIGFKNSKADSNHINRFPKGTGVAGFFADFFVKFTAAFGNLLICVQVALRNSSVITLVAFISLNQHKLLIVFRGPVLKQYLNISGLLSIIIGKTINSSKESTDLTF
jgi:hypothetical protein